MMMCEPWSILLEVLKSWLNPFDAFSIEVLKKQDEEMSAVHKPVTGTTKKC